MAQKLSRLHSDPLRKSNHIGADKMQIPFLEPLFLILCSQHKAIAQAHQFRAKPLKASLRRNIIHLHNSPKLAHSCSALNLIKI